MPGFDLDGFIQQSDMAARRTPQSQAFSQHLQYMEDDVPESAWERLSSRLAVTRQKETPLPYLEGLVCLHGNDHPQALLLFEEAIRSWPVATNPRLYYAIAAYELAPPWDSEEAYRRDFYVRSLVQGTDSPHARALGLLRDSSEAIRHGEYFTSMNLLTEAAEMSRGFYLNELLMLKCYAAQTRTATAVTEVEGRRDALYRRFPRLQQLGGSIYRLASE